MDFDLTGVQRAWKEKAEALAGTLTADATAPAVIAAAARGGLLDPQAELLATAAAVESIAFHSPAAAVALALHTATALALSSDARFSSFFDGSTVAAVGLSSDDLPVQQHGFLTGRAPWVAPITAGGVAVVGPQAGDARAAVAVRLDDPGVAVTLVETAALPGLSCGHIEFQRAACVVIGPTLPVMTRIRVLMAAAGLGMGRRALDEALTAARAAKTAAAGEQTVQGLLADAATDLDAAMLLTWKAALAAEATAGTALADASVAKLAVTAAVQRAVERTTQVVGADSFRRGHVVERLAQDVRALELFAGRTESLRAAAAEDLLPHA